MIIICKSKKDRQHKGEKKKDKQRSTKQSTSYSIPKYVRVTVLASDIYIMPCAFFGFLDELLPFNADKSVISWKVQRTGAKKK
jgi:hypothetical protein